MASTSASASYKSSLLVASPSKLLLDRRPRSHPHQRSCHPTAWTRLSFDCVKECAPATVRKSVLLRTILPAVLGAVGLFTSARAEAGSPEFYAATFFTAAVWFLTWLAWGNRRCFSGRALRETARGLALGLTLIVLFSSERSSCALSLFWLGQ